VPAVAPTVACTSGAPTSSTPLSGYLLSSRPSPAVFAVAASRAASIMNASVLSAHTAEEIICVVSVAAHARPSAVAVALAVVGDALKAEDLVRSSSR